jgi:hypothetical protein
MRHSLCQGFESIDYIYYYTSNMANMAIPSLSEVGGRL